MRVRFIKNHTGRSNPRVTSLRSILFHGHAVRRGAEYGTDVTSYVLGDAHKKCLEIARPAHSIPHVTRPIANLVVSKQFRECCSEYRDVEFLPVQFAELWDVDPKGGAEIIEAEPSPRLAVELDNDPMFVLSRLPRVAIGSAEPEYYEVICSRRSLIVASNPAELARLAMSGVIGQGLRSEVFQNMPVVYDMDGFLMSDGLFEQVRAMIDPEYFDVGRSLTIA